MRAESWRRTARTIPWLPPLIAAFVSTAIVAARHGHDAAVPLEMVAIALASGAGYALDDPAFEVLGASPTSLLRRRLLRLLVVVAPAALLWLVLVVWQGTAGREETWALMAMFAGLMGLSVGTAGIAARRSGTGRGGVVVAPALFVLLILSTMVAPRWRPLPIGDIPGGWSQIILRWTAAAAIGIVAFLLASRDPCESYQPPSARRS